MTEAERKEWNNIYKAYGRGGEERPQAASAAASPPAAAPPANWWERTKDAAGDYMKSSVTGIARGVAGFPGSPADIVKFGQLARDYMRSTDIGGPSEGTYADVRKRRDIEREAQNPAPLKPSNLQEYGSQRWIESANDQLVGDDLLYQPKDRFGRALQGIGEMAGGAAVGGIPGGVRALPGAVVRQGVIPGVAVEGAKAAGVENPLALGAIGVTAGGGASAGKTRSAETALGRRTANATPAQLQEAEALFQRAVAANLPLTRANALDAVTGGATNASNLQRVLEGQSAPELSRFYANSPERVGAAGGEALDAVGPVAQNPSTLGPRAAREMQGEITDVNTGINQQTRPQYRAIEAQPVDGATFAQLMQDPLFARTYQQVMAAPELAHLGLVPQSVGAIDKTRQLLAQGEQASRNPASADWNPTYAEGYRTNAADAQAAASTASRPYGPPAPGPSPLEAVQAEQAQLRTEHLDPLQAGPEGRVGAATTTEGAQQAMFPQKPVENAHAEVGRAVASLAQRDPQLATEFVRSHLGREFAQAMTAPQSGGGQFSWSAPAFFRQIYGNPERRAAVETAIGALPQGQGRLGAFNEIMRIFQAMGERQRVGSQTAFNKEDLGRLREAGFSEGAIKIIAGVGVKWPQKALDAVEGWRLRGNVNDLASLITDPARGPEFAAIARSAPGSPHRMALIIRMINSGGGRTAPVSSAVRQEEGRERRAGGGM